MNKLNAQDFLKMIKSGAANLEKHSQEIDTLNVFPVPDGDTGTNMSMTFTQGYLNACKCDSDAIGDVAKAFSKGLLMGARGNSGVITSQIFRGFYQAIEDQKELDVKQIGEAFEKGVRVAYKAIMKPVEGTILTVIRESSWYANHDLESQDLTVEEFFERIHKYALESVERTPEYLPVLKEVGVVDSGGTGLCRILEGFVLYLNGSPVDFEEKKEVVTVSPALQLENEEFGYCTEFIFRIHDEIIKTFDENKLKNKLSEIGESLVVVKDDDLVKVHVHTLTPGNVLNIAQRYGEFIKLKIENMQEQHSTIIENATKDVEKKKNAVIAVAAGEGITALFEQLGADIVVSGGQSMNPSTQDFVSAIKTLHAENVFIFPNNSNIILAAKQASELIKDCNVYVIETKSIPAGVSAVTCFDYDGQADDNVETCNDIIANLKDASITYAIKDTTFEGIKVKKGDYIGMSHHAIVSSGKNLEDIVKKVLDDLIEGSDLELLTVITGEGSNEDTTKEIENYVSKYDVEVQIIEGNQPVYAYLFGLE